MTTTAELARRDEYAPAQQHAAALAIQPGQTAFDKMQLAALGQMGLKDAPEGDIMVLLHVAQRTGLDPFTKQIMMIGRNEKRREKGRDGKWTDVWGTKYTIQTGIEGFRTIRSRAEREEGVRGILSRPLFYDGEGKQYPVWFFQRPAVAVEMTYTVRDRNGIETPYTSILRFDEYVQTGKGDNGEVYRIAQWATKPVHMLEKCCEADVYRKAFPQDYSAVELDDAMPAPDPEVLEAYRQPAPPVADLRQRAAAQTVTTTVVTSDPSPAASSVPLSPPAAAAGEATTLGDLRAEVSRLLEQRGVTRLENRVRIAEKIAGKPGADLTVDDTVKLRDTIEAMDAAAIDGVLAEITMADDPTAEPGE